MPRIREKGMLLHYGLGLTQLFELKKDNAQSAETAVEASVFENVEALSS